MRMFDKYLISQVPHDAASDAAAATANEAWTTGLDQETIGHVQNRGWDKKTAKEAAQEAVKAHREAEKFVGVPSDRILKLPADRNNADEMKAVWQKLGAPAEAKDYDFSTIKRAGDKPLDQAFVDGVRAAVAKQFLPKDTATEVVKGIVGVLDAQEAATNADRAAKLVEGKAELAKNWGANQEANLFVAKQGAAKLGFTPAEVDALEGVVGYAKIMEALRKVGALAGEDKFVNTDKGGTPGVMTKEQAVARKAELMADDAWKKRYLASGSAEIREMTALNNLIVAGEQW